MYGCRLVKVGEMNQTRLGPVLTLPTTHKKGPLSGALFVYGGEGEIRTLERLPVTHFPGVRLRPLGHLTVRGGIIP